MNNDSGLLRYNFMKTARCLARGLLILISLVCTITFTAYVGPLPEVLIALSMPFLTLVARS